MSPPCIGEPVSWLRLERFHLGEARDDERARITEHLAACPACAACLARIEDDDAQALPPLSLPKRTRRSVLTLFPVRAAAVIGALAAGGALVLGMRGNAHRGEVERTRLGESRIKGDAVAFTLVRDDDERIAGAAGVYRDGDRFKAVVTCPPGAGLAFDVVVYDAGGASFPLEAAGALACGNEVALPGAFRLTGDTDETVCLAWTEGAPVDRGTLAAMPSEHDGHALCKRLSPAPKPGR
ncbi:MAG TPA: hypothetical protein VGL81_16000 [Polyangiaceae bacterium]|jgi:hypothetical protein